MLRTTVICNRTGFLKERRLQHYIYLLSSGDGLGFGLSLCYEQEATQGRNSRLMSYQGYLGPQSCDWQL